MTRIVPIAALAPEDRAALLALGNAHERETSYLAPERWDRLVASASVAVAAEGAAAFLLAFAEGDDYDSPNFLWFHNRFDRFLYVDRIVVDPAARGRGVARALYGHVFAEARAAGRPRVVAEVYSDPPNPGSDAFHERLGFAAVGAATLPGGKAVRYLERVL